MDNRSITLTTNLTTEDLKRIGFGQIKTKLFVFASVIFVFVALFILGIAFLSKENNVSWTFYLPILIPAGILTFTAISLILAVNKQAKRTSEIVEQTKYIFDEQGLTAESESTSVKTLWTKFLKVNENETDFLLFTHKNIAIPIPKRFFESENQITNFRHLLSENLSEKANLKY